MKFLVILILASYFIFLVICVQALDEAPAQSVVLAILGTLLIFFVVRMVIRAHKTKSKVTKTLVIIESPFAGKTPEETERNIAYARACMHDSLTRYGEAPYASHLLYTQPGVLKDGDPEERKLGIESGLAFGRVVDKSAVYIDFSVTTGMKQGIERANKEGRTVEYRALPKDVLLELLQKFDQRPKKEIRKVK